MSQKIKQASIFGRIGTGLGKGIAEILPKEIERGRLASGLKELSKQKNLTPFEKFSSLASLPGTTPQIIQSGGELLRQEGIAQGFRNNQGQEGNPFRQPKPSQGQSAPPSGGLEKNPKGLVTGESTNAALENYIPKNRNQLIERAGELYDQNRQLYPNPEMAMQAAAQEDQQNQAISNALQGQRKSQIDVEDRVRNQLSDLRTKSNAKIPDNVFQEVENFALDQVKEGKGELEAAKAGQKKLDEISREYQDVSNLGNWSFPLQSSSEVVRSLNSLRNKFEARGDLENFADSLVGQNGLSYPKAYWQAYPIEKTPELSKEIKSLKPINKIHSGMVHHASKIKDPEKETLAIVEKLAKNLGKNGSPLAVSEELRMKGYDPNVWMDYLTKNKKKLDLTERQARELGKTRNWFPSMNDLWFSIGTGNDKLIED